MRPVDGEDAHERLSEAAAWRVRLEQPEATEADFLAFETWLAEPGARAAFDRIDAVVGEVAEQSEAIRAAIATEDASRAAQAERVAHPRLSRRAWIGGGAAAAGLGAVLVSTRRWRSFKTVIGETRIASLADGTVVRLNSATNLKVALERHSREVEMGAGEASFDVAHDAARPFEVAIGDRRIHVLGTEFNVLNLPGRVAVTVRRGVVSVSDAKGEVARLLPGEQLVFANGGVVRRGGAAEAAFAWQYGRLIYSDVSLQELAADLNRYYTPPVRVEPSAAALRFSGVLALDGQERVIHRLEAFMPIDAAPGANGGYLLRARAD